MIRKHACGLFEAAICGMLSAVDLTHCSVLNLGPGTQCTSSKMLA